jgi:hypothetical protein
MDWGGVGIADDLELVWLHHPIQRVEKQVRIFRGPEVHVQSVQSIHVFALVHGVRRGEVPLGAVLMRARCRAAVLASKAIDGQSEEAGVLVCVLDPDGIQLYVTAESAHVLSASTYWGDVRPAKASWSGVPAWFATSMRPVCRMGLW